MVLEYWKKTASGDPAAMMRAEEFVRTGYQRLLTFEVAGGGFSWFGESPANVMLSAYGLLEFSEMKRVIDIDEDLLLRTRAWLLSRRAADGHWEENRAAHSLVVGNREFALTAFVTWAMLQAGAGASEVATSVEYLVQHLSQEEDPYALSLALNVLARLAGRRSEAEHLAGKLAELAKHDKLGPVGATLVCSSGEAGGVEVTALTALGLIELGLEPAIIRSCTRRLISAKDAEGTWATTTATVLALKALLAEQTRAPTAAPFSGIVSVSVDGRHAGDIAVSNKTYDVTHLLDLKDHARPGNHTVQVDAKLSAAQVFSVQAAARYYLPWEERNPAAPPSLRVTQTFDRTHLAVDDRLTANVTLSLAGPVTGSMVLLDLGLPPGFAVEAGDLEALVSQGALSRFELTGRQIIAYLPPLPAGQPVTFAYRLRAKYPIRAVTPPSSGYEYYNPRNRVDIAPVALEVR